MQAILTPLFRPIRGFMHQRARHSFACLLVAWCIPLSSAWALISSPPGSFFDMAGGSIDMGGADLVVDGVLILGPGGSITGIRNLVIAEGGVLDISGGDIELSQQYTNGGEVLNEGGSGHITRVDGGPDNPPVGPLGPIVTEVPAVTTVTPVPGLAEAPLMVLSLLIGGWVWLRQRPMRLRHSRQAA